MNGAVELPGEANPLTSQNLYQVLTGAASANQQQIKTGTQQLANWSKQPGYHSLLQSIFINASLPFEVRYLSAIQLKNGIDKCWRKYSKHIIAQDEKNLIRSKCLDASINEPNHQLALQNALGIAKIVRSDYPSDWPEAIPSILENLRQATHAPRNPCHLHRTLTILLYIVKECKSVKTLRGKANLGEIAPEILRVLGGIYVNKVNEWQTILQSGGSDGTATLEAIEHSLLALRVLRRLLVAFFDYPSQDTEVPEFWKIVNGQLYSMLPLALNDSSTLNVAVRSLVGKSLVQIAKYHLDIAQTHPTGFALLPNSTDLARAYWDLIKQFGPSFGSQSLDAATTNSYAHADKDETPIIEQITIKGLLLLRACNKLVVNPARTFAYETTEVKAQKEFARQLMRTELLAEGFVREVMETLVPQYFVFRPEDLREWEDEPEEWEHSAEGESELWELSIRSCSEKLFLDLVISNKDLLVPRLLEVFQTVAKVENSNVALKDSVYCAIGLAAPVLETKLDFGNFLTSTLAPEVQIQRPGYHILRRRIAIVLGQWLPVLEGLDRPLVYQIFQYLLDPNSNHDKVVRITAGRQFKNVVDPFDFDGQHFKPFAKAIIASLLGLIGEVDLTDTKLALLNTLSSLVLRMEIHVVDFADLIMHTLPPLWDAAGEEYLFKQSIFTITAALMTSIGESSSKYHSMLIPLVRSCIEPDSPTRVYLLEDAVDLWAKILEQASSPSSELTSLAVYLFSMFSLASDTLRVALEITESYITLVPREILGSAADLLSALQPLLGGLKSRDTYRVTNLIELLIRVALLTGGITALEHLTSALISSNILYTILSTVQSTYEANQTTGPNSIPPPLDSLVEIDYLSILARLAIASPQLFVSAVTAVSPSLGEHFETTIKWLSAEWFSHLDNIGHPDRKKLSVLALTALFTTAEPWILGRMQDLMCAWTETIIELTDEESGRDSMVFADTRSPKTAGETAKETRMRSVDREDVVGKHDIKEFVRSAVHAVVQKIGTEQFKDWVSNVDKDAVARFEALRVV